MASCHFFAQGRCLYGDDCRYSHGEEGAPKAPAEPIAAPVTATPVQIGGGSTRLGRWSGGSVESEHGFEEEPEPPVERNFSNASSEDFMLVYAGLPTKAMAIPGSPGSGGSGSGASDALAQALSGSSSPLDNYGLGSLGKTSTMSPEEEAALEDAIATQMMMGSDGGGEGSWGGITMPYSSPSHRSAGSSLLSRSGLSHDSGADSGSVSGSVQSAGSGGFSSKLQFPPEPEPEQEPESQPGFRDELCQYHMAGYCHSGLSCPFVHGEMCPTCGINCIHPFDEQKAAIHLAECAEALQVEHERAASADLDCGICMEKPFMKGLKFGILPSCQHVFCLDCIRSWRTNSEVYGADAVRVCPICRVESYIVVPCERFVDDESRKVQLIDQYKGTLKRIPCKYFKFGEGTCPFSVGGTIQGSGGCMFAHTGRDGLPIEDNRLYMGEDGELQRIRTYDLCDFIAPKKTQGSRKKKR